ncbi:NAD(P)H-hydrate dehydratase [Quadrisphaera sp. DSM 44207]|uniref:NAD(P)H-hydrate dehydratase n=1 Tax=Quadrisphaera sp. DSM 44207 TaxID=1881057 RepID=UPI00087ED6DA|nr:NAD(P)H-hydrate dehydratase [Quadrisphaera sp. DSM 44207]SDQ85910.1 yjeF C-terminal region, hydroxyethylthiazole kinase-related [Quadrisphaera sp. DSM 44207]
MPTSPPPPEGAAPASATPVTPAVLRAWRLPPPGVGKDARGRVLVVGGSDQTPGAVMLAAEAALRSGAGKLQVATAASVARAVAVALPEALVLPLPETPDGDVAPSAAQRVAEAAQGSSAVLLGPGVRDVDAVRELLDALVPQLGPDAVGTVVLDAAAHAWVGARLRDGGSGLGSLRGRALLTPNPTELALTLGVEREAVVREPAAHALALARAAGAVVSCGGGESWIAAPDGRTWCDRTGGTGLGVSGSGDVLAGIVTGLAARGAEPAQAAVWGAHLHGRAGDRLAAGVGPLGFLARELLPQVPRVLTEVEG